MNEQFVTRQELADVVQHLATKQDLAQLRADTKQDLAELRRDLRGEFKQDLADQSEKLIEVIRDAQTEVLRAFHNWARPVEGRLNRTDELAQRMSWLENRISELERKNPPSISL